MSKFLILSFHLCLGTFPFFLVISSDPRLECDSDSKPNFALVPIAYGKVEATLRFLFFPDVNKNCKHLLLARLLSSFYTFIKMCCRCYGLSKSESSGESCKKLQDGAATKGEDYGATE